MGDPTKDMQNGHYEVVHETMDDRDARKTQLRIPQSTRVEQKEIP